MAGMGRLRVWLTAAALIAAFVLPANGIVAIAAGTPVPGYAVSDFATGFASTCCFNGIGPVGVSFDAAGFLFVSDYPNGQVYKFGSSGGTADSTTLVGTVPGSRATGLAFAKDGRLYMAQQSIGKVVQLSPTTAAVVGTAASGLSNPTGLAIDPISGDLFVSQAGGGPTVWRVANPQNNPGTATPYASVDVDGITFAPDGTLFASGNGTVYRIAGTNASTPGAVANIASVPGADGIALVAPLSGHPITQLVVNTLYTIYLVDFSVTPATVTPIVTNGSRGDFVAVGPDKCLYATQSTNVEKITAADGSCPFLPTGVLVPPTITLAPLFQSVPSAVMATVTATLADSAGNPSPGITVTFSVVSGPQVGASGTGVTDAFGQTSFNIANDVTAASTDTVVASFTDINGVVHSSNEVQISMLQPPAPLPGAPGQAMSFTSPDFKVVRYIHTFDKSACQIDLEFNLPASETDAGLACDGLLSSANPVPPNLLDNHSWTEFLASNQYRGIIHVPALHVTCSKDRKITSFDQGQQFEKGLEVSDGFTPTGNGNFDPAEPYRGSLAGLFNDPDLTVTPTGDAVIVSYIGGSRLSTTARLFVFELLGYDAPFVWTVFREKVSCTSFNVVIVNSDFPTTNMYVDNKLAMFQPQTPRLANFIRSGGTQLHDIGIGFLDPICSMNEATTHGSPLIPLPRLNPTNCALAILTENWPYMG